MGTMVPKTERQARELSKAPPEKQAEVWEIAEVIGWSRSKVADYSSLKKICIKAWGLIVATFSVSSLSHKSNGATEFVAIATVTESILRHVLKLTADQQTELIEALISGEINNDGTISETLPFPVVGRVRAIKKVAEHRKKSVKAHYE